MIARTLLCTLTVSLLLGGAALAQSDRPGHTSPRPGDNHEGISAMKDRTAGAVGAMSAEMISSTKGFIQGAAMSDMYEVEAGTIAVERGKSRDVRDFGQKMTQAHTETTNTLKGILARDHIRVDAPDMLDHRHQGMIDDLRGAKGRDFDHRYIEQQVAAHREAQILMRGYAKDGDNRDIREFARDTLPKVQDHLQMAQSMERRIRQR